MNRPRALADALLAGIAPACEYHHDEPRALAEAAQRLHRRFVPTNEEVAQAAHILSHALDANLAGAIAMDISAGAATLRVTQQALTARMVYALAYSVSEAKERRLRATRPRD